MARTTRRSLVRVVELEGGPTLTLYSALDDSDIQILKTYVCYKILERAYDHQWFGLGTRAICQTPERGGKGYQGSTEADK